MGLPVDKLYVTNINDPSGEVLMSAWVPLKKDGGYVMPPNTPIGYDMFVPNLINLREEDGTIEIELEKSNTPTGLWLICPSGCYFGDETHLYNAEVRYKEGTKSFDHDFYEKHGPNADYFGLHVSVNFEMHEGDGPYYITYKRKK